MPKMPIPGMGWLAYYKDTEGNIFSMMQSDSQCEVIRTIHSDFLATTHRS